MIGTIIPHALLLFSIHSTVIPVMISRINIFNIPRATRKADIAILNLVPQDAPWLQYSSRCHHSNLMQRFFCFCASILWGSISRNEVYCLRSSIFFTTMSHCKNIHGVHSRNFAFSFHVFIPNTAICNFCSIS